MPSTPGTTPAARGEYKTPAAGAAVAGGRTDPGRRGTVAINRCSAPLSTAAQPRGAAAAAGHAGPTHLAGGVSERELL